MAKNVVYLDDSNFDVSTANGVTLVDFYADWCGPCRMIAPIIDELSVEFQGKATIAKVDVDKAPQVAQRFKVTSIPTIIICKNGKEIERVVGMRDKEGLIALLSKSI